MSAPAAGSTRWPGSKRTTPGPSFSTTGNASSATPKATGKQTFILTGDLHNSFAIKIEPNVWEFASGPHNSINHAPEADEADRPANGRFQYGPRPCEIRWSSYAMTDIPPARPPVPPLLCRPNQQRLQPTADARRSRPLGGLAQPPRPLPLLRRPHRGTPLRGDDPRGGQEKATANQGMNGTAVDLSDRR